MSTTKIFYNFKRQTWQTVGKERLFWGKNKAPLACGMKDLKDSFLMVKKGEKIGPLVGILASKEGRADFYGNKKTFKHILHFLQKQGGGIAFVFTPEGIHCNDVEGYFFQKGVWKKALFPFPDVIYNRVASYQADRKLDLVKQFANKHSILFYNPHFFEKWELYKQLSLNLICKKHLPDTDLLSDFLSFEKKLLAKQSFMIKPVLSSRGNGIILVVKDRDKFKLKTNEKTTEFTTAEELWDAIKTKKKMLLQQKIPLQQFEERFFDLRVLVQRVKSSWNISGIGVRRARKEAITTHVPQGGDIVSFEQVKNRVDTEQLSKLVKEIASQLELAYGYLCEFSVDIGIDPDGKLWIFEVNSKPMKFDEPHIFEKGMKTLVQCFCDDSGF